MIVPESMGLPVPVLSKRFCAFASSTAVSSTLCATCARSLRYS
jgi:hypothetical protein